jgi:hypothetical protein
VLPAQGLLLFDPERGPRAMTDMEDVHGVFVFVQLVDDSVRVRFLAKEQMAQDLVF